MTVFAMLSMRQAVFLLASSAAVTATGPSIPNDSPPTTLECLAVRVQRPGDAELSLLPLYLGHNRTGPETDFNPNVTEYSAVVPGFNATAAAITSVRLYAVRDEALRSEKGHLRLVSYTNPDDFDEDGFDNGDQFEDLEDPYCSKQMFDQKKCNPAQTGGFLQPLNPHEGGRTKFELIVCQYKDGGEQTCEEAGTTYTVYVYFPDWNKSVAPGAPISWGWIYGCVLCIISAFLYACGICCQRYGLSMGSDSRDIRLSVSGIHGSELDMSTSVASHIVTAPPGSSAGQMVSISVNGRQMNVEVPVGVSGGDQFSVPIVDGGMGLSEDSPSGCVSVCSKPNLIWVFGMFMWFVGNSLYTYALDYAPLSLLTALFATVLVFNGLLAWFFLHEKVRQSDILGWCLIMIGISICGVFIDKDIRRFSAKQIVKLAGGLAALVYEFCVIAMIVSISAGVFVWTRRNPAAGTVGPFPIFMQLAFPCVIAMYECLIQICLKGISNMVYITLHPTVSNGDNQFEEPIFWVIFALCGFCSFMVMFWMRLGYARFEAVQMLPVQSKLIHPFHRVSPPTMVATCIGLSYLCAGGLTVATLTTCTVIGGLMFYGE